MGTNTYTTSQLMIKTLRIVMMLSLLMFQVCLLAQKMVFAPQWTPQAQFAGFYIAEEKEFYKEVGIDISIVHPTGSLSVSALFSEGKVDIATLSLAQALILRSQGVELVNVAQTSQQNGLCLVSNESVESLSDLYGKSIGKWKAGHDELAIVAVADHNLIVNWVPTLSGVNLFLSGAVDATLCMSYNEFSKIEECGRIIDSSQVIRFSKIGYNMPEEGIYVRRSYYNENKNLVDRFVQASIKGWLWARENREDATDIVMSILRQSKVASNRYHQKMMLDEILNLQCPIGETKPTFVLKREDFERSQAIMSKGHKIDKAVTFESIMP